MVEEFGKNLQSTKAPGHKGSGYLCSQLLGVKMGC